MPRYVIHIGPHKTGSSYLQVLFRQFAPLLLERGVLYPGEWLGDEAPGHFLLARRLRSGTDPGLADEFQRLNASPCHTILLSSEDLCSLTVEQIATLRAYLGEQPAIVVYYCRSWLQLLPSSWQESVKHGQSVTLPEFMAGNLMNPFGSHLINYAVRLDRVEQIFGKDNIFLVSYNNIVDRGGDLGGHFLGEFLSWRDAPVIAGLRPNPSLGPFDIETIRALNGVEWAPDAPRDASLRVRFMNMKPTLPLSTLFAAMENHRGAVRLNENSRGLRTLHEEMFDQYGGRLVGPKSGRYFFSQKQGAIEYIRQDYLLMPGVVDNLRAVHAMVRGNSWGRP
jgi:hypothetical protein